MMLTSILLLLIIIGSLIYTKLKKAYISQSLVIANFLIFLIMAFTAIFLHQRPDSTGEFFNDTFAELGHKPNYLRNFEKPWTIFTAMFIHASIIHVMMNMFFLVLLGLPFEERVGTKNFGIIYFASGIFATLINDIFAIFFGKAFSLSPNIIGIGASGAIFGIMGGFAILFPRDKVIMPLGPILMLHPIPVILAVILFGGVETAYVFYQTQDNVGHLVHVGGLIGGVILAPMLVKEKVEKKSIDIDVLKKLAIDQKEIIERIESEDEKEVRDAWIEYLLKKAKCPKCGKKLDLKGDNVVCECGFKIGIMKKVNNV